MMSQPIKIEHVSLKEAMYKGGHAIKDDKGNLIKTREYHFYNSTGEKIIIQEHSAGHKRVISRLIFILDLKIIHEQEKYWEQKNIIILMSLIHIKISSTTKAELISV